MQFLFCILTAFKNKIKKKIQRLNARKRRTKNDLKYIIYKNFLLCLKIRVVYPICCEHIIKPIFTRFEIFFFIVVFFISYIFWKISKESRYLFDFNLYSKIKKKLIKNQPSNNINLFCRSNCNKINYQNTVWCFYKKRLRNLNVFWI